MSAVSLLADGFVNGLRHPGNKQQKPQTITIPGFRHTGIPAEMAQHFAQQAGFPRSDAPQLIAEAVLNTLAEGGFTVIRTGELEELRQQAADAPDGVRVVRVVDRATNKHLFDLTIGKTDTVMVNAKTLGLR